MAIPKHYRLVKEHKDSYEMHDTRDQKHFHIAKKELSKSMQKQVAGVQKLWDGGDVKRSGLLGTQNKVDQELEDIRHPVLNPVIRGTGDVRTADQKARAAEYERTGMIPPAHPTSNLAGGDEGYAYGGEVANATEIKPDKGFGKIIIIDKNKDQSVNNLADGGFAATPEQRQQLAQTMGLNPVAVDPNDPNAIALQQKEQQRLALLSALPKAPDNLSVEGHRIVEGPVQVDTSQIVPSAVQTSGGQAQTSTAVAPDITKEMDVANQQAQTGIALQSGAEATKAQDLTKMYQAQQNDMIRLSNQHEQRAKAMNDRSNDLFNNIQSGKIDPNKYWDNHSKVTASLGILLSGIGQGLERSTENLALKTIQNNIDREIDAQKSNMSNKNNLFKMNLEQAHNEAEAYAMTKSDFLTMTAAKASEIASKVGTAEAEAKKNMLLSQLGTQQAQLHQQIAVAGIGRKAYTDGIPAAAVPYLHPDVQKRMVPLPNGMMADAGSDKSAETVKETLAPIQSVKSGLDRLEELSHVYARLPAGPERARAESEVNGIVSGLMEVYNQKRIADPAVNFQLQKFDNPMHIDQILNGNAGTDQLRKVLDSKMDSIYRVNVPAYSAQKAKESKIPFKKNY